MKPAPIIAASIAHALAWAAFLWIALWPHYYQGVAATPVQVDEQGNRVSTEEIEEVRFSSSFVEENGIWALLPLFIPVAITGLALMMLLTIRRKTFLNTLLLWVLTVATLAFCLLTSLSLGLIYTVSAVVLLIAACIFSYRPPLPRVPQE